MRRTMMTLATALVALAANYASADIVGGTSNYFAYGYKSGAYAEMVFAPGYGGKTGEELTHQRFNSQYVNGWGWAAVGNGWFNSNGKPNTVNTSVPVSGAGNYQGKYLTHYSYNDSSSNALVNGAKGNGAVFGGNVTNINAGKTIAEGNAWTHQYQQRPGIVWETLGVKGTNSSTASVRAGTNDQGYGFGTSLLSGKYRNSGGEFNGAALANVRQQALATQGLNDTTARFNYFVIDLTGIDSSMVSFSGNLTIGNIGSGSISYNSLNTQTNTQTIDTSKLVYGKVNIFAVDSDMLVTSYGVKGNIKLASSGTTTGESSFNEWSLYFVTDIQADAAQVAQFANLKNAVNTANTSLDAANANLAAAKTLVDSVNAQVAAYETALANGEFASYEEALAAYEEVAAAYDAAKEAADSAEGLVAADAAAKAAADAALAAYQQYGFDRSANSTYLGYIDAALAEPFIVDTSLTAGLASAFTAADFTLNALDDAPENAATPEPATLLIFGLGIAGAAFARRRRK